MAALEGRQGAPQRGRACSERMAAGAALDDVDDHQRPRGSPTSKDNLKAVDVRRAAKELLLLDAFAKPTFGFPQNMQPMFPTIHNGGRP